ncbi:serine hydrolase domain-containing protein [Amycolatopsis sp. RTGN1]|uniref:serine hydrolase domain-containing protein n=1 Tax=Amycolatopsis ponsaeliensis TaxID=2992142 RepID=UPI0025518B7A|nr:serine hydrolase domain-containing protein [Amycolatopsis sp. RTGN1]
MTWPVDADDLSGLLTGLVREYGVPGAQLAVRWRSRTVTAEAGEETAGTGHPVARTSAFPVGSLTKPFTATLVMLLAEDGDVELDQPVAKYLPQLGSATSGAGQVTPRQLLSHTGGLVANLGEQAPGTDRRRWLEGGPAPELVHPPGTAFSYSNAGYLLAGCLVEAITGMSWAEAVESILLRPLGITPSSALGAARPPVTGHVVRPGGRVLPVAEQTVTALEEPVAALAAGAADLVAFAAAHLPTAAGPVDRRTAEAMRNDQTAGLTAGPFGLADGWGLGWSLYRGTGARWFGHDGTGDGTWCHLRAEPDSGTVVALVTNASNGVFLWDALVERLRASGLAVGSCSMVAPAEPRDPVAGRAECAGRYCNGDTTYTIEAENGRLFLTVDAEPATELTCLADLRFTTVGPTPLLGRFGRDPETGAVDHVQITGRLARRAGTGHRRKDEEA